MELIDYNPKIANGDVGRGDNDHYWLEIDGKVVDLTADQFDDLDQDLPPIVYGLYEEYPNYVVNKYETSFIRFVRLYNHYLQRSKAPDHSGDPKMEHNTSTQRVFC